MRKGWIGAIAAAGLAWAGAPSAQAQQSSGAVTTFAGGGLADSCADAAARGETGVRAEQICAQALDTLALQPMDRAGTMVNLGIIRLRSGRYQEADGDFSMAIRYMPDLAEAYVNRGAARIGMRKFKEAVADVDKALELGVKEPQKAYYDRALAYEWLDNPKAAYADYKKALEISPAWDLAREQMYRFKFTHAEVVEADPPAQPPKP
jgi:tetratricopeptide (TPR) repeat protein